MKKGKQENGYFSCFSDGNMDPAVAMNIKNLIMVHMSTSTALIPHCL